MTAARQPARPGPGWALTALRRAIGALRYVHDENVRASEAIFRPVRAAAADRVEAPGAAYPSTAPIVR